MKPRDHYHSVRVKSWFAAATWLLKHVGRGNEALHGDLLEELRRGRSAVWYWKQVLVAILVERYKVILLMLGIVAVYRIGGHIPLPGVNTKALTVLGRGASGATFRMYDLFAGGNLSRVTVFALGITPYVSASMIVQLIAVLGRFLTNTRYTAWTWLIARFTWPTALTLCAIQAAGIALFLERQSRMPGGLIHVEHAGWVFRLSAVLMLTAGCAGLMWISDAITMRRIGNGMFLVFLLALLSGLQSLEWAPSLTEAGRIAGTVAVVAVVSRGYRLAIQRERLS